MIRRGEIWRIDLDPTKGSEIQKVRPVVVVSADTIGILDLKVVVPVTDWKPRYASYPWMVQLTPVPENGLSKVSAVDCYQVRSVSVDRFIKCVGTVSASGLDDILAAIQIVLGV